MTKASIGRVRKAQLTYGNVCTLNGCNQPRKSGHKWCALHKRRSIYRGSPEQSKINRRDINFARKTVLFLIQDNQTNPAWHDLMAAIQSNWDAGVKAVNQELLLSASGLAMNRLRRNGLRICSAIFTGVGLEKTFITYCAWQYLQEFNPNQFATDTSFRHLLVKSLRNQAKDYRASDVNKKTGKSTVYSSPLYMNERDCVWEVMSGIFGATGMKLYTQLEKRAERLRQNNLNINKAIKNIQ